MLDLELVEMAGTCTGWLRRVHRPPYGFLHASPEHPTIASVEKAEIKVDEPGAVVEFRPVVQEVVQDQAKLVNLWSIRYISSGHGDLAAQLTGTLRR